MNESDELRKLFILPAAPSLCQYCAVAHSLEEPHNPQSFYYQMAFYQRNGRWPTWDDAMDHCAPAVQAVLWEALKAYGIAPQRLPHVDTT